MLPLEGKLDNITPLLDVAVVNKMIHDAKMKWNKMQEMLDKTSEG